MVGSAKLGFSLSPEHLWRPFNDESDIDMALISPTIFDDFWMQLYTFDIDLTARTENQNWRYKEFLRYFFKGWLRPDLFPFEYPGKEKWERFYHSISYGEFGDYKIDGVVFKDWHFFEGYHSKNINRLRRH
jgi:hypothetical protein